MRSLRVILIAAVLSCAPFPALGAGGDETAAAAFMKQDWATAAKLYAGLASEQPTTANLWRLGRAYMGLERYSDAKPVLLHALEVTPDDPQTAFSLALTLDHLGDADGAFRYLDIAAAKGLMPRMLQTHPALAHLRADARFAAVVERADRAVHVCKYDDRYRLLDFWRGDWDGYAGGQKILRETVSVEVEGCMLREEWEGADGGHGRSENFYDPKSRDWQQVWVDAGGNVVRLSGGRTAENVVQMTGDNIDASGGVHRMRQTWTRQADGKLQRLFEQSDDDGRTWKTMMQVELRPAGAASTSDA